MIVVNPDFTGECRDLFAPVAARLLKFSQEQFDEVDPIETTRMYLARSIMRDPTLRLHVITQGGRVVGFTLATIERAGSRQWIYIMFAKVDEGVDAQGEMGDCLADIEQWARDNKINRLLMATSRNPQAWARKYGWEPDRHVMKKRVT